MKSKIYENEVVHNKKKYISASSTYYPVEFIDNMGRKHKMLFTPNEIIVAQKRAKSNPEDFIEEPGFLYKLFKKIMPF
jgi:hypothetical protein